MVDGASPISSVSWQAHSSLPRNARSIRTRLASESALAMFMNSRIASTFRQESKDFKSRPPEPTKHLRIQATLIISPK